MRDLLLPAGHAGLESVLLLVGGDAEPVLDKDDAAVGKHLLKEGHRPHELLVLLLRAESHHPLHLPTRSESRGSGGGQEGVRRGFIGQV
eukprot:1187180-Prorocentrum_minimum.AAC.1